MFKNVFIAEDHESINISVRKSLDDLGVANKVFRNYCDDAFTLLLLSLQLEKPYELLITDLSFEEDSNTQILKGGRDLINACKAEYPALKVIVFSLESNAAVVDELFDACGIDAYVRKARHDAEDLKRAIHAVYQNKKYRSADLRRSKLLNNSFDFKTYDVEVLQMLSSGKAQKEISAILKEKNLQPSGLSSIEKRLGEIRSSLDISNNVQLIAYCKDNQII